MKRFARSILGIFLFSAASAQESYTIRMELLVEGLPEEYAAFADQDIVTQIKGTMSRTEVNGMLYTSLVFFRNDTLTTLNDAMGNKSGFSASRAELDREMAAEKANKPRITYTGEKKTIAGYACTKAIIEQVIERKTGGKDTVRSVAWVTEKIRTDQTPRHAQQRRGGVNLGDLKGHPLEIEIRHRESGNDVRIVMTTLSVDTTALPDELFVPDTKGYRMLSYEDWKSTSGAGR